MNKPRVGTVLKILYRLQTKRLNRVVSYSRVCSEQQSSFGNKYIFDYKKELQVRADIRRKGKVEKEIEFVKRMRKVQKKYGVV